MKSYTELRTRYIGYSALELLLLHDRYTRLIGVNQTSKNLLEVYKIELGWEEIKQCRLDYERDDRDIQDIIDRKFNNN